MTLDHTKLLDKMGWRLLRALQENARLSYAELGRQVGLSLPAVAERVRRMEEAGIITGYHAEVNLNKIGWPITAFIRMHTPREQYPALITLLNRLPQVRECHHLSGTDSFIIRVVLASIPQLEELIDQLSPYGQTTTSIVLSSPVVKCIIEPSLDVAEAEQQG